AISGGGLGRSMTPPGDGPRMPGALDTLVDALTGSAAVSGSFAANGWNGDGKAEVKGRSSGVESSGPEIDLLDGQLKLGELKAYADVFDASARGSLRHGDLTVTGAAAASYGADATASAGLTKDGLEANAELSVGLRAAVRESANYGILGAHAGVEGLAGAAAGAGLTVAKDEVEVAGEAFAGGKVSGDLGADVGGIGAGVHGAAWAGVGAELRGGYEYKDGKFHLGGHAGAALGIGGAVGFDVTIDPEEIGHTAMAAADAIGHGLDTGLGTGLDTALDTVGHAGDDTVRNIGDAASSLAHHLGL
ncbi:MAG: hypothetical protein M3Z25_24385, partial [Actinomycetota bacterium]|nr:hypothetical protein [Actinomycetota bacterium]